MGIVRDYLRRFALGLMEIGDAIESGILLDAKLKALGDELKQHITTQGAFVMSTLEEKITELNGVLDNIGSSVTGVMSDVNELMAEVTALKDQLAQGQLSAEQEAALNAVVSRASTVKDNLAAIDAMNPTTPSTPPA